MRQLTFLLFLVVPALCLGGDRFLLESELRTNFGDNGSTSQLFTGYTYDAAGNRVLQRVWNGIDSAAAPMSSIKFTYDISGNLIEELLLFGSDTSSIVRYIYRDGKLVAVRTLGKNGAVRFTDSLVYDAQGRNIEEQRVSSAGVMTYFHRYTLDAQGRKLADSLFELVGAAYVASQAVLFTYNMNSTVASETQWRLSGNSWYCISTAFMNYADGTLASVATHERDGAGTAMTDSLAYAYDANGNRTREEDFNGESALISRVAYSWRDTQSTIVLMKGKTRDDHWFVMGNKQGLSIDYALRNHGEISIYGISGRRFCRIAVDQSGAIPLQGLIGKGSYTAVCTGGSAKRILNFTKYN
jgi:YD repeat-containing protein